MNVTLWTYVSNRDLRVLYFDGMSAQLGESGILDSQEVFLARKGGVFVGSGWWDDYARLRALCDWAAGKGVEGFIRTNTGFELMWCDFNSGLDLIGKVNVTPPDTLNQPFGRLPPIEECTPHPVDYSVLPHISPFLDGHREPPPPDNLNGPSSPPDSPYRPFPFERPPLTFASGFEWLRTAVRRFHDPQPNVRLVSSGMVSFYSPDLISLFPARVGRQMRSHRFWHNISDPDANMVANRMENVLRRDDLWTKDSIAWQSIASRVIENWGDRITQINFTLSNPKLNTSSVVRDVQLLVYTLLNPHLDTSTLPHLNGSNSGLWLPPTLQRCIVSYTSFIRTNSLTEEERLLKASIETVMGRLCNYAGSVFAQSLEAKPMVELISAWTEHTSALMDWLDWAAWVRCEPACGVDVSISFSTPILH
jgi:hypothetical protein